MGLAAPLSAQKKAERDANAGWWPWEGGGWEQQDRDDRDRSRDDRDDARASNAKRGNGPPFCRNGQGHPVHGMEWCRDKGWSQAGWRDVILRERLPYDRRLEQPTLRDILGSVVFGRLSEYAERTGTRGPLDGRALDIGRGSVLQLRAGGFPLAELTDRDGDGTIDLVLLARGS